MKRFEIEAVQIVRTYIRFEIEAEDEVEAIDLAYEMYESGDLDDKFADASMRFGDERTEFDVMDSSEIEED